MNKNILNHLNIIILVVVLLLVAMLIYFWIDHQVQNSVRSKIKESSINIESLIQQQYFRYKKDISYLKDSPYINQLLTDNTESIEPSLWMKENGHKQLDLIKQVFAAFMRNNENFGQIRIISEKGKEIVRVDRTANAVVPIMPKDLQDKSARFYIEPTLNLSNGEFFISRIDLNREFGEIQKPFMPFIRISTPLYSQDKRSIGLLIANIDPQPLISAAKQQLDDDLKLFITDNEGFFIEHFNERYKYSRDLTPTLTVDSVYRKVNNNSLDQFININTDELIRAANKTITIDDNFPDANLNLHVVMPSNKYNQLIAQQTSVVFVTFAVVVSIATLFIYRLYSTNAKLQQSTDRNRELATSLDVIQDALVILDSAFKVKYTNVAGMNIFGAVNIKGQAFRNLFTDESNIKATDEWLSGIGTPDHNSTINYEITDKKGVSSYFKATLAFIRADDPSYGYVIVFTDFTSERFAFDKLTETNQLLEERVEARTADLKASRDEAFSYSELKSKFITTVSHEMRTPLNGLVSTIDILRSEISDTRHAEILKVAQLSSHMLLTLINDILDLSKIEAGKLELNFKDIKLEPFIESISSTFTVLAKQKNIELYVDTSQLGLESMYTEPQRLSQIVNNLLSNAIKFTKSGYICIKCWSEIQDDNKAMFHLEVTDTGIGIEKEAKEHLFEQFTQANQNISSEYGGTGLGLSICKELAKLLGGTIGVSSTKDVGSTFSVSISSEQVRQKSQTARLKLNNISVYLLVDKPKLHSIIADMVESVSGKIIASDNALPDDLNFDDIDTIIVESCHKDYEKIKALFQQQSELSIKSVQLVVLSEKPISRDKLPTDALNLLQPVYPSALIQILEKGTLPATSALNSDDENLQGEADKGAEFNQHSQHAGQILVVDDNEINIKIIEYILQPLGYSIYTATNGEEALIKLASHEDSIDIVLMDCNMPIMNGFEATESIRAGQAGSANKDIPVFAMTANAMHGESEKCFNAGMNEYLVKPIEKQHLIKVIHQYLSVKVSSSNMQTNAVELEQAKEVSSSVHWNRGEAIARLGNQEGLLKELVTLFLKNCDAKFSEIKHAVEAKDRELTRQTAHALKGNCADIGANKLYSILFELETCANQYSFEKLNQLLDDIEPELNQLKSTLMEFNKA